MIFTDLNLVGEAIRNYRKDKKLRLEDLADDNISVSTISNIERGFAHVKQEKVYYLLKKLGIDFDDLAEIEEKLQKQDVQISLQLTALETWLVCDEEEKALTELNKLQLTDNHLLAARATYLKGKCFSQLGEWKKAIQAYYEAIRLDRLQEIEDHLEADCYSELSKCAYQQNELKQAIAYVEKGLAVFQEGDRSDPYFALLRNKAHLLLKQDRQAEALKLVKETWPLLQELQQVELVLGFYQLRVALLIETGLMDEALSCAEEGITLAAQNDQYDALCVLWCLLGKIHANQFQLALAEVCYRTSQIFEYHVKDKTSLISTYTSYGRLLRELKRYSDAEIMLNKAIVLGEKHHEIIELVRAYMELGQTQLIGTGNQRAMNYFHKARALAAKHNLPNLAYEAIFQVAKVYQELDSEKFIACTIEMYEMQAVISDNNN